MRALAVQGPLVVPPERRGEGGAVGWVGDHLQHHAYTDKAGDPHSPLAYRQPLGFLWAHVGWLFWLTVPPPGWRQSSRLDNDPVAVWQYRWYWPLALCGFVLPWMVAGWSGLFIAGFVRATVYLHITWSVNSVCHLWGSRARSADGTPMSDDASRNNPLVALVSFGEGWHSNHHADPNSAELGVRWWQVDPGKLFIFGLNFFGMAHHVRRFSRT